MNATFREASETDAAAWQALLEGSPSGDPLHDWEWRAVAAFDRTPQRSFVLEEGDELTAICAAQVRRTRLGRSFWYVPHGPVLDYDQPRAGERLRSILDGLRVAARADRAIAVRIEPRVEAASVAAGLFAAAHLHRVEATLQSPATRLVTLLPDDEALMATLDKDTRREIRRAERAGVTTRVIDDAADDAAIESLHALVTGTMTRAHYLLPRLERYRIAWRQLAGAGRARIVEARHGDAIESAGFLAVEGDRSFCLYSGSVREAQGQPKHYAPYAMQWQRMLAARAMGARIHDLGGVAPESAGPEHPWYGYSQYKKGFGGRYLEWAGSWDLVIDPGVYRLRDLAARLRRR